MIALLLAALGALMYYADEIPELGEHKAAAPLALQDPPEIHAVAPEPVPENPIISETESIPVPPVFTAATTFRQPTEDKPGYVPFLRPAIVNSDGSIVDPATAPVEQFTEATTIPDLQSEPGIEVRYVTAQSVNVREGPSTGHPVLGRVIFAEAVQILSDPTKDWVLIRIEGDGIEGFMASRFLHPENPQG